MVIGPSAGAVQVVMGFNLEMVGCQAVAAASRLHDPHPDQ